MDNVVVLTCKCSKLCIILLSNVFTPTKTSLKRPRNINWSVVDNFSHQIDSSHLKGTYYLVLTQKEDKSAEP